MAELYQGVNSSLTTLSDDTPPFDSSFYDAVVEELYGLGGYTPEYLTSDNGAALINETYDILSGAVNVGLNEEVDPIFREALENNVFIFSGFKTHQELEEVNALLRDENDNIKPFDQFKLDVLKINEKYNVNYLQAEYNMAVQSAQMASKWKDFEAHKDFVNLQYRTAGDDRVRAEHQALDGTTLPVEDAFWKDYLPPLGWNCRCTVVEVLKDSVPVSNSEQAIKAGEMATSKPAQKIFRFNPGITKQVFPPKHPYYKVGGGIKEVVNSLLTEKRVNNIPIKNNNSYLTPKEEKAIAQNNVEIENKIGIKKGNPMSIEDADRQKANPKVKEKGYTSNCSACTAAYILRKRGFNVTAAPYKSSNKNIVRKIAFFENWPDKWRTIDGQKPKIITIVEWMKQNNYKQLNAQKIKEFIEAVCTTNGTYEIGLPLKTMGHYTIIEKTDNGIMWIDPQFDIVNKYDITLLYKNIRQIRQNTPFEYCGVLRVDNLVFNTKYTDILIYDK